MNLYLYKATMKSPADGRTFTQNIKSPVSHNLDSLRKKLEERSDAVVTELSAVSVYPKPDIPEKDLVYNLYYAGVYYIVGPEGEMPVDVSRQIIPMYNMDYNSLHDVDNADVQKYLQGIYGQTFKLTYAQLVQTN